MNLVYNAFPIKDPINYIVLDVIHILISLKFRIQFLWSKYGHVETSFYWCRALPAQLTATYLYNTKGKEELLLSLCFIEVWMKEPQPGFSCMWVII